MNWICGKIGARARPPKYVLSGLAFCPTEIRPSSITRFVRTGNKTRLLQKKFGSLGEA